MEQKKKEEQEKENSRILTEKLEAAGKSTKNLKFTLKGKDGSKGDDNKVENKNNHLETMVNTNF